MSYAFLALQAKEQKGPYRYIKCMRGMVRARRNVPVCIGSPWWRSDWHVRLLGVQWTGEVRWAVKRAKKEQDRACNS